MLKAALVLLLGLARGLAAFGGTSETWLAGTQPWDTVPYKELNLGLQARGGDGRPALGPLAEAGIFDQLMLAGTWMQPLEGSGSGRALLKWREAAFPRWRPAMAFYGGADLRPGNNAAMAGAVLAIEPWDNSIAANFEYFGFNGLAVLRFGYWSPYVVSFIRLGCEAAWDRQLGANPWELTPQLTVQLPGDLSAVLGAQTLTNGQGQWAWMARISYQLFPTP